MSRLLVCLGLMSLWLCFAQTSIAANLTPKAYAYSMFAPGANGQNILFARVVLAAPGLACPVLVGDDGSKVKMSLRPLNLPNSQQLDETNFAVTVCEAVIQPDVAYAESAMGIALSKVSKQTQNVQVYGDSGCKTRDCGLNAPSTHFQSLSNYGAQQPVDLILHMGDYNYRGTSAHFADKKVDGVKTKIYAYDAGDTPTPEPSCSYNDPYNSQNSANSPKPDNWQTWQADFFSAAQTLLPKAPWVFTRGNHELCSRAGPGWFYFLGPGSSLPGSGLAQTQCPDQGDFDQPPATAEGHITVIPSYMLNFDRLDVWVTDSANACDDFNNNPLAQIYQAQFQRLADQPPSSKPTWVIGHRPIWGYQGGNSSMNYMQQAAIRNTQNQTLPSSVSLSLAGHMHIYESITFLDSNDQPTGRPPQIVIGNSGVALSGAPGGGELSCLDGQRALYNSENTQYGYLQMAVNSSGAWSGGLKNAAGGDIALCDSANPSNSKSICVLSSGNGD